jgi:archaetidylinositol phosphate synthase
VPIELVRKHQAITFEIEKKILDYIAARMHKYVTADQMSLLALGGAVMGSIAYIMAGQNLNWLLLACLGIFIHWFGDSLDGRTARLRNENRPLYGHYLDHILDALSAVIICFGISVSEITLQSTWVWIMVIFLLLMIHSYLKASVTGVFELSMERLGGTEVRILLIILNLVILISGNPVIDLPIFDKGRLIDYLGMVMAGLLLYNLLTAVRKTLWGKGRIRENTKN